MSHSSNVQMDIDLVKMINNSKSTGNIRAFKFTIKDEKIVLDELHEPQSTWDEDYECFIKKIFCEDEPCFVLIRMDIKTFADSYDWLLISWSPDTSSVRQKMICASSKNILKKSFSSGSLVNDFFASSQDELNSLVDTIKKDKTNELDPCLLTTHEQDLLFVKRNEAASRFTKDSITLLGIEFPITDSAVESLFKFKDGLVGYIQLSIDVVKEIIQLELCEAMNDFDINNLSKKVPPTSARYHLFIFPHKHEGKSCKSVIFAYSVPLNSCSVKERMLYSSCKAPLLNAIQDKNNIGIEITKKLEIDDPSELSVNALLDQLYPKEITSGLKFAKPAGPAGKRGARRLIK